VLRFNKTAKEFLAGKESDQTLGEFLVQYQFSDAFIHNYLVPMGAAIWSSEPEQINEFPAKSFLTFFNQHGLLNLKHRPQWKTIVGGSNQYVKELIKPFINKIHLNTPVECIKRVAQRVEIFAKGRKPEYFDHVFIACHSDQALNLLDQPTTDEANILGSIRYQANTAVLHTDQSLMPSRKSAWSSWNYYIPEQDSDNVKVTYYMNKLQNLSVNQDYFVTLNLDEKIDQKKIFKKISYSHPVFDHSAIKAQKQHTFINGTDNTWYCGAYWRNGFHEDGVWSAFQSVEQFTTLIEHEELYLQRAS
jgi:predicted NAD/FAD-binding protein